MNELHFIYLFTSIKSTTECYKYILQTYHAGSQIQDHEGNNLCDGASATTISTAIIPTGPSFHGGGGEYLENYETLCIIVVL